MMCKQWTGYGLLGLLLVVAVGCADAAGGASKTNNNGEEPQSPTPRDFAQPEQGANHVPVEVDPGDVINTRYTLEIIGEASFTMNYLNETTLQVRYLDPDGQLVRGEEVSFTWQGARADMELSSQVVTTNAQGIAEVTVSSGRTQNNYVLQVDARNARPVQFEILVQPKERASYLVHTLYEDEFTPDLVSVRLLPNSVDCEGLNPFALPQDVERFDVIPAVDSIPDARFVDLPNGQSFTVVSVGLNPNEVPVAFGCNQERPVITDGFDAEVTVEMEPLQPSLRGTYELETRVDLLDALPEPWSTNLTIIGRIFAEPDELILDLLLGEPGNTQDGLLGGSIIVDNPLLRVWIRDGVNYLLDQVLSEELRRVFDVGGALYRAVSQFTLAGELVLVSEPMPDGSLLLTNEHRYNTLRLRWDVDCPDNAPPECGLIEIDMGERNDLGTFYGEFGGALTRTAHGDYLEIDRHSFTFNYGALILSVVEQLVFPAIFGPNVDSVGDALNQLLDCQGFADSVFDPVNDALLNQALYGACSEVIVELEDQIVGLIVANTSDIPNLTFGTFEAANDAQLRELGCVIDEPLVYPPEADERYYGRLGTEADRCLWDARFETSGEVRQIDGDFYGWR